MPELSPETWAQIRYEYEHTDRPIADICAERGISDTTLRNRRRRWGWTPRRAPIPREGPPATARIGTPAAAQYSVKPTDEQFVLPPLEKGRSPAEAGGEGGRVGIEASCTETVDPHPIPPLSKGREDAVANSDPAALAPRLQSAVARVLPAIEATLTKLTASPQRPRELEQTARALGALMRTLRELNALLAQQPARSAYDDDDFPEDIDAFRDELARRIDAFIASRGDEFGAAAPPGESEAATES